MCTGHPRLRRPPPNYHTQEQLRAPAPGHETALMMQRMPSPAEPTLRVTPRLPALTQKSTPPKPNKPAAMDRCSLTAAPHPYHGSKWCSAAASSPDSPGAHTPRCRTKLRSRPLTRVGNPRTREPMTLGAQPPCMASPLGEPHGTGSSPEGCPRQMSTTRTRLPCPRRAQQAATALPPSQPQ